MKFETKDSLPVTVHVMPLRIDVNSVNSTTTTTTTYVKLLVSWLTWFTGVATHYYLSTFPSTHQTSNYRLLFASFSVNSKLVRPFRSLFGPFRSLFGPFRCLGRPVTNCHTFSDPLPLEHDILYGRPLITKTFNRVFLLLFKI